jgi:hypothetical protein
VLALGACGQALAGMEAQEFSATAITTAAKTNSYVLRGELYAVYVDCAAGKTNTVTITDSFGTIFTKAALTADALYPLLYPAYSSAAAALTFVGGTNNTANVVYAKRGLASAVTCVITPAAGTTGTNTFKAYVIYNRE